MIENKYKCSKSKFLFNQDLKVNKLESCNSIKETINDHID